MRIPALGKWEPLAFASPSMALIAFVIVFPLAYSFYLSFQNFDLSVGPEYEFVGAKNYTEASFRDQRFLGSVWNTALLIAPSLLLELLPAREWDKVTERRGLEKQKAAWGEKLAEMKQIGIEYKPDWAAKAK